MNLILYGIIQNWRAVANDGSLIGLTPGAISIETQYENPQRNLWERTHIDAPLNIEDADRVEAIYQALTRADKIQIAWWYFGSARATADVLPWREVREIAERFERKVAREFGIWV